MGSWPHFLGLIGREDILILLVLWRMAFSDISISWSLRCQILEAVFGFLPLYPKKVNTFSFFSLTLELHDGGRNRGWTLFPRVMISILHYPQKQILKLNFREGQVLYFLIVLLHFFHCFSIANVSHYFSFFLSPGFVYQRQTWYCTVPLIYEFHIVRTWTTITDSGRTRMFSGISLAVN